MNFVSERGGRFAVACATIVLAFLALLALTARAQAAELVYWDNYRAEPGTVSFANIDGSGGGPLNLTGLTLESPEGMAFDSVSGRLYIASSEGGPDNKGQIAYANVDGSGAGVLATPGAEVDNPYGLAVDPATRVVYWVNGGSGPEAKGSIAFARLDGLGGGLLNTAGAEVNEPYRLAIDPASGKVFWANLGTTPNSLGFANLNNTGGGGTLSLPSATSTIYGIGVDSAAGRVYWLDSTSGSQKLLFVNINGSGGGEINIAGGVNKAGYGLAIDPTIGRFYWGNYGEGASTPEAIGFVNFAGGGGAITPVTAPVNGAQDPVILKSPSGTAAPAITRNAQLPNELACSQGGWAGDFSGGFVYQAPRNLAYQWTRNGSPVPGATTAGLTATAPGSYACTVTAANHAGSTAQGSAAINVKAAKVKLIVKKKVKTAPGKLAAFKVRAKNQGDLKSKKARVCVKLPKNAKGDLTVKGKKCKPLGKVQAKGKKARGLKIKVGPDASGVYKLKFQVKGSAGKAAKSKIVVR